MTMYAERLRRIQAAMHGEKIDLFLVSPSADLRYLTGYEGHVSERPTLLALRVDGDPLMLIAGLEAPRAAGIEDVRLVPYEETDNPYLSLFEALGRPQPATVAITDQTWARVLLELQGVMEDAQFVSAAGTMRLLRMVKSDAECDLLHRAGSIADRAFEALVQLRFAGRTERQIAAALEELLREGGLTTGAFGPIVASGPNSASPHHITGDREIHEGDALVLDFGGTLDGYMADTTRTVHVGTPSDEFVHVYEVVRQAQDAAVQAVQPGVAAQTIDAAARDIISAAGYGAFFIHRTGHGIGLDTHEEPYIVAGNSLPLEAGMTFSVEPGVYLPNRFGIRIEDIVAVGESGALRLNEAPRELIVVH